ncbi:hypothetical protein LMG26854_06154 [Achromobacter aegrifaciens]|nr:hypothetical protein LMG26854_06154 [Achromobacter aegrifaciens]
MLDTQPRPPVLQLAVALAGIEPIPLPDGIVGKLHWQSIQLLRVCAASISIQNQEFVQQYSHGRAIPRYVVQYDAQHMLIFADLP